MVRPATVTGSEASKTNEGTFSKATDATRTASPWRSTRARASTGPAGVSNRISMRGASPSARAHIRSRSMAMVVTAMMPWPHMVLQPSLCMKSTPAWASGDTGSVSSAPYMSVWPRGSSIIARRKWSSRFMAHARFSSMVRPSGVGSPSTTRRSGSPAACASMVCMR